MTVTTMAKTDSMSGQQYGDWFEGVCQSMLDQSMQKGPSFFSRLYDSRSAGSFLPQQAADFIGAHHGKPFLLEAKGSIVHDSLMASGAMRKLLKDHQVLASYLMQRAGGLGLIAFRSRVSEMVEIWDGGIIRPVYNTPRGKLSPADGLIVRCRCSDAELLDNLTYIFQRVFQ